MKLLYPFFLSLCLSPFFLLTSCDNTPPTEAMETPPAIAEETQVVVEDSPPAVVLDTIAIDTVSVDTVKEVRKVDRPTRAPAKIKFKKISYTYDTIKQGDVVEYNFEFENIGERPLTIKDVKGSCGCTIGSYPFLDIAPNEKNAIKARFDSKGKVGPQFTTVTVYSNGNPKGDVLSLKGFVVEE
ncbi:MAG: Unknown protein [uncultured Aureispira sp.]|uniref:DUF1573 domain-containing protein n=1 Tax=uncultured Aureispira sp. TaxID=1331704 RepID=A0A6S6UJ75_9BACT|nr:MAG: Unknown protein [uncultured Aureispira sp.]